MDVDLMHRRVAEARVGRLATVRSDGSPAQVPCCFALVEGTVYTAVDDLKPKSSLALARIANVEANPAASLLVDHYADDWSELWWVRVDGDARVVGTGSLEHATAIESLGAKYEQYARHPPPGAVIALTGRWTAWP